MTRLLLVEDDANVREPLAEQLSPSFAVTAVGDLAQARKAMNKGFEIVILDWELPDGEGLDLLKEWRAQGLKIPVIFLTARTDVVDKVIGLELGADDYMTKPFELKELIARLRLRLRQNIKRAGDVLAFGEIQMNVEKREVTFQGHKVSLKKMEFELLRYFLENPGRALGRDEILDKVWGLENFPTSRTIDTHVLVLRKKFGNELFETLHGVGYRFKAGA